MTDQQKAVNDETILGVLQKKLFPLIVALATILLGMIGGFLWSFYLKVDNIQSTVNLYQVDNATLKEKVSSLEKDVQILKQQNFIKQTP